jgi:hypothetical protein
MFIQQSFIASTTIKFIFGGNMADLTQHIQKQIEKLHSPNPNTRYDGCQFLAAAPSITPEAIKALQDTLNDPDKNVVREAKRALRIHSMTEPSNGEKIISSETTTPKDIPTRASHLPLDHSQDVLPASLAIPSMPNSSPNSPEYIFALEKRIMILEEELRRCSKEINQAISLSNNTIAKIPDSAIMSPSFLTRAFALWGHVLIAGLIIALPIYCIIYMIGLANIR